MLVVVVVFVLNLDYFHFQTYSGERRTVGNGRNATENTRKLEAVFRAGLSRIFSGGIRQLPVLSVRNRPEIIGKNLETSGREYCFHIPAISRVFLQDTLTFSAFSGRFLQYPFSGTIDLGSNEEPIPVTNSRTAWMRNRWESVGIPSNSVSNQFPELLTGTGSLSERLISSDNSKHEGEYGKRFRNRIQFPIFRNRSELLRLGRMNFGISWNC